MHSGLHGLTRCPCSNNVCHVSLVKSCTTSPTLMHRGCLGELQESVPRLDRDGFIAGPCWEVLRRGVRPRLPWIVERGEGHHGWQYCSSSSSEHHLRETVVLAQSCAGRPRPLRSHSGPCASQVLHGARSAALFRVKPLLFRTLATEGQVGTRWLSRFSKPIPCSNPPFWPSSFQSSPYRTHSRACVPRGCFYREPDSQVAGHEHQRPSDGTNGQSKCWFPDWS